MHLDFPLWFEITSFIALIAVLGVDLTLAYRRPHVPSAKESGLWVGFYVVLALVFALCVYLVGGQEHAGQFVAGWLTEYSLSIDNLFVFVLVMARFAVPRKLQQEALMAGIIIALVLRGVFILLGASLIANFAWIFYLFGAFLLYTAIKQAFGTEEEESEDNAFTRFVRHHLRVSTVYNEGKLRVKIDGRRMFTPMVMVIIALGTTDLLFALDSIPAIFGITTSPFLVFTSNLFALMGLRQLYFLLGHLLEKLEYLKYGIAVILAFIGIKLVLHAMHENEVPFINGGHRIGWAPEISTGISLLVILAAMLIATLASVVRMRRTR